MDVFEAFPKAVISSVWQIGEVQRATEVGDVFTAPTELDVIVEEAGIGELQNTPEADAIDNDTLIYAKPNQLPSTIPAVLVGAYMLKNTETETFYAIDGADVGKNQETGEVEHVELWIRETEALEDDD